MPAFEYLLALLGAKYLSHLLLQNVNCILQLILLMLRVLLAFFIHVLFLYLTADFVSKMYDLCSVIKISLQLAVNSLSTDFGHMNSCKMKLVCNEQCYC